MQRGTFKSLALVVPWNIQDQAATYIAACGGFQTVILNSVLIYIPLNVPMKSMTNGMLL